MVDEAIHLRDNSVDVIDFKTRNKIRVPNAASESCWGKAWVSQRVCRPIRGSSLYLENIQGATRPNDDICICIDLRCKCQRASQGWGPLVYEEIRKKIVSLLTQKGKAESSLLLCPASTPMARRRSGSWRRGSPTCRRS